MYIYPSQNPTPSQPITIGSTIRIVLNDNRYPLNFANFADYKVIDIDENNIIVDFNNPLKFEQFTPNKNHDISQLPDRILNMRQINIKYIWLTTNKI